MQNQPSNNTASRIHRWPAPRTVLLLSALLLVVIGASSALVLASDESEKWGTTEAAVQMHFTWQAPTTGTPAVHYVAQVLVNERDTLELGPLTATEVTIDAEFGNKYRIRVAAVDAAGIQGPMSLWSEPHSPELGPPSF